MALGFKKSVSGFRVQHPVSTVNRIRNYIMMKTSSFSIKAYKTQGEKLQLSKNL